MIPIQRLEAPSTLTADLARSLTTEYLADNTKRVWNRRDIRERLAAMSNGKCAYCEARLDEKSQFMEIDHFRNKRRYPGVVLDWNNLLPACKGCNVSKGDHDVEKEPIIDPSKSDPKSDLALRNFRFYGKTEIGKATASVLDLNDSERNVKPRFKVGEAIAEYCLDLDRMCSDFASSLSVRRRNSIVNKINRLLLEANPSSEFASVAATIMVHDLHFQSTLTRLKYLELWSSEMETRYNQAAEIAY